MFCLRGGERFPLSLSIQISSKHCPDISWPIRVFQLRIYAHIRHCRHFKDMITLHISEKLFDGWHMTVLLLAWRWKWAEKALIVQILNFLVLLSTLLITITVDISAVQCLKWKRLAISLKDGLPQSSLWMIRNVIRYCISRLNKLQTYCSVC